MRIALIADIHGNSIALDAVLADVLAQHPDIYYFVGDLADGHDPSGVLARIVALPNAYALLGNTELYVMTGNGPPALTIERIKETPERLPIFQEATASWAWCRGWLCATGWFDWIAALPLERSMLLPNGQTLRCVHSTPGYADGPGIGPHTDDAELEALLAGCEGEIICVGHTHVPFVRVSGATTVINPGCVSNPLAPDLRASYALLDADAHGFTVEHRRVAYDHQAVVDAVRKAQHPAARFIVNHQLGLHTVEGMVQSAIARRQMIK